jgi:hypothetical protein
MSYQAFHAHFDGEKIVPDEPLTLSKDTPLLITVLPAADVSKEEISDVTWLRAAANSEAFKFLADPSEDIYSIADGEPFHDEV